MTFNTTNKMINSNFCHPTLIRSWFQLHMSDAGALALSSFLIGRSIPEAVAIRFAKWYLESNTPADIADDHLSIVSNAAVEAAKGYSKLSVTCQVCLAVGLLEYAQRSENAALIDRFYGSACYAILYAIPQEVKLELLVLLSAYINNHELPTRKIRNVSFKLISVCIIAEILWRVSRQVVDEINHERIDESVLNDAAQHKLLFSIDADLDASAQYQSLAFRLKDPEGYVHRIVNILFRHLHIQ